MNRPKLLDLYCGGGGCSRGYDLAGFEVVGCDIEAQKRYPYPFVQADALTLLDCLLEGGSFTANDGQGCGLSYRLSDFAAVHASPPCQDSTVLKALHKDKEYPKLIGPTRDLLLATGLPYVIENVPPRRDAAERLIDPILLCGTMFGLRTSCGAELRRHRLFEINWGFILVPPCQHYSKRTLGVYGTEQPMEGRRTVICVMGDHARNRAHDMHKRKVITVTGNTPQQNVVKNTIRETFPVSAAREAMGIDWLPMSGLSQAIPPAYTEWLGLRLREVLA